MSREEYKGAIEASVIFHEGQRMFAVPKQPAPVQQEPEIVQRVKRYAGQTLRTARNPNITARECIELANWIAAAPQPAQRKPLTDEGIVAGARVLNQRMAEQWGADADDQWVLYADDLKADARAVLEAAHGIKENT